MQSKKTNSPGFSNSFRKCTKYLSAFAAELNSRKLQKVTLLSYTTQWETLRLFKLMCKTWALKQLSKYYGRSLGWQFPQCSCLPLASDKGFTLPILVAAIRWGRGCAANRFCCTAPAQSHSKRVKEVYQDSPLQIFGNTWNLCDVRPVKRLVYLSRSQQKINPKPRLW